MSNNIIFHNRVKNSQPLAFNDKPLQTVDIGDKQVWISAQSLNEALGYSKDGKVSELYKEHADEFTAQMSKITLTPVSGGCVENAKTKQRIFSLRGCHLIAMFSRTKIAKDFRKFVLDILDNENEKQIRQISVPTEMGKWRYHNITKVRRDLLGCKIEKLPLEAYEDRKHLVDKWKCLTFIKNTVLLRYQLQKGVHPERVNNILDLKEETGFKTSTHEELNMQYFKYENQNWFSIADLGNEETMQERGLYYYIARLPQEYKIQVKVNTEVYPFTLMKISLKHELFAEFPKIYVSEQGLDALMDDLSHSSKLPSKIHQFQIQNREELSLVA